MDKLCTTCGATKLFSEFHKDKNKAHGLASRCKSCARERARQWTKDNRERNRISCATWYAANREHVRTAYAAYARSNPEKIRSAAKRWRDANKKQKREADLKWHRANVALTRAYRIVSEARRRAASGKISAADVEDIVKLQRGKCAICRVSLAKSGRHIDHIVPLSKGGSNFRANIQALCPPSNLSKHATDPLIFMQGRGFLL